MKLQQAFEVVLGMAEELEEYRPWTPLEQEALDKVAECVATYTHDHPEEG